MTTKRIIDLQEATVSEDMWVVTDNATTGTKKLNAKELWDAATNAATATQAAETAAQAAQSVVDNVRTMTAAAADTLFSADTETETFAQRVSAADGRCRVESLQGNTVVWNQLVSSPDNATGWRKTIGTTNATAEVENNALKITIGDVSSGGNSVVISAQLGTNYTSGHKYMLKANTSNTNILSRWNLLDGWSGGAGALPNTQGVQSIIATATATSANSPFAAITFMPNSTPTQAVGTVIYVYSISCFDLTLMFGAGNEPATVAEFEAQFPEAYYPYDAGSLQSVNIEGIESAGETLAIPAATYFPNGMRGAGSARDELTADAAVTRVGVVDLGTLTWTYNSTQQRFYSIVSTASFTTNSAAVPDIIIAGYDVVPFNTMTSDLTNMRCTALSSNGQYVSVRNTAYTDPAALKAALSGVMLYYELATPTETAIDPPLNLTYPTEQGGTESIVIPTGESSAPPVLVTTQAKNADGVADMALSQVAPVENGSASTNYAVGSYLVHDGTLYRVTSAIATGEAITEGTNVTATTVMAEIVRLTS